ncbi:MAG TPA: transcriptional repressor [Chitinispirillaceae bacterium]|nr:transcriptional repressor [Chitinispirillaceae bacterium]
MMQNNTETDQFIQLLRNQGCRITPVVISVVKYLYKTSVVKTTQQLREEISMRLGYEVNLATIYRVLERLLQCGIVCSMHKNDGVMRYYLCHNPQHAEHHHFICSKCLKVQEVPVCFSENFSRYVEENLHATVDTHFIQLEGLCASCRRKTV